MKNKHFTTILIFLFLIFSCEFTKETKKVKNKFPSYNSSFPPPSNEKEIFALSQDYPDTFSLDEKYPWANIDFKSDYKKYMKSVLNYCLEGNIDTDFKVQNNKIRKWYHAPWLDYGLNGREYHHGLTRERPVPPKELSVGQDIWLENWAIGFYNAPGGYTIGKVWNTDTIPSVVLANFPEGTVAFKLLFTSSPVVKLPFLIGTKEWVANIYKCNPQLDTTCAKVRNDDVLRLLQIDIAVKDKRAGTTGWVFGTFVYDASQRGTSVWEKIIPVGLMWGDDSKVDTLLHKEGAFLNASLKETILNPYLLPSTNAPKNRTFLSHHGLGGRLNGPVDNPISSCISCHSKAAIMANGFPAPLADFSLNRQNFTSDAFNKFFSEIEGGIGKIDYDNKTFDKLDYSLQLAAGIRNFYQAKHDTINKSNLNKLNKFNNISKFIKKLPEVSRGNN